ncbi:MAG: radical SAM protein [Candidatus Delongbacteria bacterium]|nr:radical SAM protein [Candidatus Delongbacteria bacterium]
MKLETVFNKINVLFLQFYGSAQPLNAEPLSIEVLIAALNDHYGNAINISFDLIDNVKLKDFNLTDHPTFDIICASIPQSTFELSHKYLKYLLSGSNRDSLLILGHAIPANLPGLFFNEFPNAIIVNTWGEETLIDLVDAFILQKPIDEIPNITYLNNGKLISTKIKWPNQITIPKRIMIRNFFNRIEASRGCSYNACSFCTRPKHSNCVTWQGAELSDIEKQLKWLSSQNLATFTFTDEDFFGNDYERALDIADLVSKHGQFHFSLSMRPDNIFSSLTPDSNKIKLSAIKNLQQAGLASIFLGVESFSQSQLDRYKKGTHVDDIKTSISIICDLGIDLELGLILLDPLVSKSEIIDNSGIIDTNSYWKFIGQLFNHMRVQVGSPICKLYKLENLISELNNEMIEYSYKFKDPQISALFYFLISWKDRIDDIYLSIRNITRTETGLFRTLAQEFCQNYRLCQNQLLKEIINNDFIISESFIQKSKEQQSQLIATLFDSPLSKSTLITDQIIKKIRQIRNCE